MNLQAWLHELHGCWCPSSANQTLEKLCESSTVSFQRANDDHDDVGVGVKFGSVNDSVVNLRIKHFTNQRQISLTSSHLLCSVNLLHATRNKFDRQELADFVADVEGRVKYDVPADGSDEKLR